jgi:hypothetical protein
MLYGDTHACLCVRAECRSEVGACMHVGSEGPDLMCLDLAMCRRLRSGRRHCGRQRECLRARAEQDDWLAGRTRPAREDQQHVGRGGKVGCEDALSLLGVACSPPPIYCSPTSLPRVCQWSMRCKEPGERTSRARGWRWRVLVSQGEGLAGVKAGSRKVR